MKKITMTGKKTLSSTSHTRVILSAHHETRVSKEHTQIHIDFIFVRRHIVYDQAANLRGVHVPEIEHAFIYAHSICLICCLFWHTSVLVCRW